MVKLAFDIDRVDVSRTARDQPRYSAAEAAGYLQIPVSTIRSWFFGTTHGTGRNKSVFEPVLDPADITAKLLSFDNLIEAYVLRQFRERDNLALREIVKAAERAKNEYDIAKPLLSRDLLKVGNSLFLKTAAGVRGLNDPGQLLLPNAEKFFARIDYADAGAMTLYPATRPLGDSSVDEWPKIVSISPEHAFGRSVIHRNKIGTNVIRERYINGDSIADLAEDFVCEPNEIEEAIRAEWTFAHGQKRAA